MDTEKKLRKLRDEFIKISKNREDIWRVEHAGDMQDLPAVTFQHADFADGPKGHGYIMTVNVNLYARPDEIEKALTTEIMSRIKWNQSLLLLDNPESQRPDFESSRGKRSPEKQVKELQTCLDIYKMAVRGKSNDEIIKKIYKINPPGKDDDIDFDAQLNAYESAKVKVYQHKRKVPKLIEAAKNGTFPDIA